MTEKTLSSWLVPAVFWLLSCMVFLFMLDWFGVTLWLIVPGGFGLLFGVVTITEFLGYIREQAIERAEREQRAMALTADSYLAEQMRGLSSQSPELANSIAQRIGRPDLILFPGMHGRHPQVIIAGSDVTLLFALHVLEKSDDKTMLAQRNFQDGTYHWDKNGLISDRQQWMQLNWLLSQENICTRYQPGLKVNHPPLWLPPWTPQRVLENWLLGDVLEPFAYLLEKEVG